MKIYFDEDGSLAGLRKNIAKALKDGARGLILLACEDDQFKPADLNPILKAAAAPLAGGVFPAILHGRKAYRKGTLVLGFEGRVVTGSVSGLSSDAPDMEGPLEKLADSARAARTMVVFVDGFSRHITPFVRCLFDIFGLSLNYIGGGAGSLTGKRGPCLFSNHGMSEDGAVMALLETPSGVGVSHGWHAMSEPLQATETDGNILKAIDFKPAFDVYSGIVKAKTGISIKKSDFLKIAKAYPFGIARMDQEMIVRDPLVARPDGAFICAGEIPQDSYVSIMTGTEKSLLAAAQCAASRAVQALPGRKPDSFLLMDCISRLLFLGGGFKQELERLSPPGCPSAGACTIGEIANSGMEFLEFYNKTAVAAALGEK